MHVYLIRHAQCEINVLLDSASRTRRLSRTAFNVLISSATESPLTPAGVMQAQRLAQCFVGRRLDRLYTSPLPRAVATATMLSETTNVAFQMIEDLRELRSVPLREGASEFALWQLFWHSYTLTLFSPISLDTFGLVYQRARTVWNQITREPAEAIAVVSHGMFLRFLLLSVWTDRRWRIVSRDLTNCGVSLIVPRRSESSLEVRNRA
jgi:broad specificity phosphatase PhoE